MVAWRNPLRIPEYCDGLSFFSYAPIRPITAPHRLAQHQQYFYTRNKSLWDPRPFTPDAFYTEQFLQQKHFTPNSSCTRRPKHHTPFAPELTYSTGLLHQKPFYTSNTQETKTICLSFTHETHLKSRPQLDMHREVFSSSRKYQLK